MAKNVLCVDLGNVLIRFDESPLRKFLKEEKFASFLNVIYEHDRGQIDFFDLYLKLCAGNYFKDFVSLADFSAAYSMCIANVNYPMFLDLLKLKETGRVRLVCITDNNPFCFYQTILKFPGVAKLFDENGKPQWVLSYKLRALKKDLWPFVRASSDFGFSRKEAVFVDDMAHNLDAFVKTGFARSSCFLYKIGDAENHVRFQKFLAKHFPAKA